MYCMYSAFIRILSLSAKFAPAPYDTSDSEAEADAETPGPDTEAVNSPLVDQNSCSTLLTKYSLKSCAFCRGPSPNFSQSPGTAAFLTICRFPASRPGHFDQKLDDSGRPDTTAHSPTGVGPGEPLDLSGHQSLNQCREVFLVRIAVTH